MTFGLLLKDLRIDRKLTLRTCSAGLGVDASNWSKMERGITPAPRDIAVLDRWANFFCLRLHMRQSFFDLAALSRHELPPDITSNRKIMRALPASL